MMTTELVTIEMLRPGVPFYLDNPLFNKDCLPQYNVDCPLDPDTEVYVIFPDWQTNPFIKKECRFVEKSLRGLSGIINSVPPDWL